MVALRSRHRLFERLHGLIGDWQAPRLDRSANRLGPAGGRPARPACLPERLGGPRAGCSGGRTPVRPQSLNCCCRTEGLC